MTETLRSQVNSAIIAGQWYRLFTASLLHGGIIHLLVRRPDHPPQHPSPLPSHSTPVYSGNRPLSCVWQVNCFSLNNIGPPVEAVSGRERFLCIYTGAAFAGGFASFCFNSAPSVGASGALRC